MGLYLMCDCTYLITIHKRDVCLYFIKKFNALWYGQWYSTVCYCYYTVMRRTMLRSRHLGCTTTINPISLKRKQFFSFSTVLYENSYNFGEWHHSRGVLSRGHRAYVVNSKFVCELLTLYYYNIYFLNYFPCVKICWNQWFLGLELFKFCLKAL